MQGSTNRSEFRIPDSELDGSVELRVPSPQPSRLTPVPSDKILFPRRMLYVEAVLYATVAVAAFGLGYLAGRDPRAGAPPSAAGPQDSERVPVEGKVLRDAGRGTPQGDAGALVIVLPADKLPNKRLPLDGLRPGDTGDATSAALAKFGGAAIRADASGGFTLLVPAAGRYHVLILSRNGTRIPEPGDITELGKYFDAPADLLKDCRYRWLKDLRLGTGSIEVQFSE